MMDMSNAALAAWLRKKLNDRDWNLSDFAERIEKRPSVVSRWVRGERVPDPQSCDLIADVLGVDRDVVLALAGHRPEADPIPAGDPRRELHALIDKIAWTDDDPVTRIVAGMLQKIREDQAKARGGAGR